MSDVHAHFTDGVLTISDDAGHSQSLTLSEGDLALTGLRPFGREDDTGQTRGAWTGSRLGARAFPQITFTAKASSPTRAFNTLAHGRTAAFVSTSAGLSGTPANGGVPTVDVTFAFSIGAETRNYVLDDCTLTDFGTSEGSPTNVDTWTFEAKGPVTTTGSEGTVTLIASR